MNSIIGDDIHRQFMRVTWINPQGRLHLKMAFYAKHFMDLRDELVVPTNYTLRHSMHALHIPLGQFRVVSHRLRIEMDHQINQSDRIYQICRLQEVET
jgi:hypothetical protein